MADDKFLTETVATLEKAEQYMQHDWYCASTEKMRDCNCGYDTIIQQVWALIARYKKELGNEI